MSSNIIYSRELIEGFINSHVIVHNLNQRTEKAYRLDLEHFYTWAKEMGFTQRERKNNEQNRDKLTPNKTKKHENVSKSGNTIRMEHWEILINAYLDYLEQEKKLSSSTICRKNRVLSYYLSYLAEQGLISDFHALKQIRRHIKTDRDLPLPQGQLSKKDADAFFTAMNREYKQLDSEFRKRICLRDMVMMELLFYHKIKISELLQINVPDYDVETKTLMVRKKKGNDYSICLFSQELQQKMEHWLEERIYFRKDGEFRERIFLSKLGKPLSMEMFIQIFDKYRKLAGIEKEFTPRDLKESSMKQYARELVMERCS